MAVKNDESNIELERVILQIVQKIKANRNRPSFDNIYAKLVKNGQDIVLDDAKVFIENMTSKGLLKKNIQIKENCEQESFSIVEDSKNTGGTLTEKMCENVADNESPTINIVKKMMDEFEQRLESKMQNFVIDNIPKTSHIHLTKLPPIPHATTELFNVQPLNSKTVKLKKSVDSDSVCDDNANKTKNRGIDTTNTLLDSLFSEIKFLRDEVKSKDAIIKLLAEERNKTTNSESFVESKRTSNTNTNNNNNDNNSSSSSNNNPSSIVSDTSFGVLLARVYEF